MTISPAPCKPVSPVEPAPEPPKEAKEKPAAAKPRVTAKKKITTQKSLEEKVPEKPEEPKVGFDLTVEDSVVGKNLLISTKFSKYLNDILKQVTKLYHSKNYD